MGSPWLSPLSSTINTVPRRPWPEVAGLLNVPPGVLGFLGRRPRSPSAAFSADTFEPRPLRNVARQRMGIFRPVRVWRDHRYLRLSEVLELWHRRFDPPPGLRGSRLDCRILFSV